MFRPAAPEAAPDRQRLVLLREQLKNRVTRDTTTALELADVQLQLGETDAGTARCRQCALWGHWRGAAKVLHERLGPQSAEELLLEVLECSAGAQQAEVCSLLGQLKSSEEWYRKALKIEPSCSAMLLLAELLHQQDRFTEAAEMFRAASLQQPLSERHLFCFGEALVLAGRCEHGRDVLAQLLKRPESDCHAMALATTALSHALQQQHAAAIECCQAAGAQASGLAGFIEALCHLRCGSLAAAHSAAGRALAGGTMREHLLGVMCRAEVLNGNYLAAERCYTAAQPVQCIDTKMAGAFLYLAQLQEDEAEEMLQAALSQEPNSPEALLLMGQLLLRQGHKELATEYLQKCLRQSFTLFYGRMEQTLVHLAACICYGGEEAKEHGSGLRAHFRWAVELEPQIRNAVAACADAGALTALLRPRGLAIHLDAQEAALLQQLALEDGEKLVGTASTAMPSGGPSRQNSETRAESLAKMMSAEKLISFDELHFGELLSRGEHTTVQKASYRGSAVVVKALHHQAILYHQDAVEDLLAEIRILSRLSHPRLIPLVGACLESQRLALLTELAPGGNLHHALHVRKVEFSRKQRFELATEFLEGVRYLHSLQPAVLHLDLKSMNLVLDAALQHLRICDFGLSVLSGVRRNLQRGGSPRYMAPECFDETLGVLTEKTDVWSSACILLEMFGSCQPYAECSNLQQILNMLLVQRQPPSVPESVEPALRSLVVNALQHEAGSRPQVDLVLLQLQAASEPVSKSRFQWIP